RAAVKRATVTVSAPVRDAKIAARCGGIALADLKDRLGFGATCPAAASIGDVTSCTAAALEQRTERHVGTLMPRSCALLRAAGQLTGYEDTCVPSCGN